ncbi:MAG: hypothetical protein K2Q06_06090 [Parvularculaceae bacterium]|nr:hypothetical protein [Parvularculaceae bacterium]
MAKLLAMRGNFRAAREGDWQRDIDGLPGFAVRLKSLSCDAALAYQDRLNRALFGAKRYAKVKGYPPEVMAYLQARTLVDVCLADWTGLDVPVDADGRLCFDPARVVGEKALPFSPELAAEILLEESEDGGIWTSPPPGEKPRFYPTPDFRRAREDMRDFIATLAQVSLATAAIDDEDDDAKKTAGAAGSPGPAAKTRKPTQSPPETDSAS